jgi:hypothetical protein
MYGILVWNGLTLLIIKLSVPLKIKFLESYTMSAGVSKVTDFFEDS